MVLHMLSDTVHSMAPGSVVWGTTNWDVTWKHICDACKLSPSTITSIGTPRSCIEGESSGSIVNTSVGQGLQEDLCVALEVQTKPALLQELYDSSILQRLHLEHMAEAQLTDVLGCSSKGEGYLVEVMATCP